MSTKYRMWFNYDNDKKTNCIPALPEKIKVTVKGQTSSTTIDRLGEILHKGKRDAIVISFSSFFPPEYDSDCDCAENQFKSPKAMHKAILQLINASKPMHFVLTGSALNLNMYADIISYIPTEEGGDVGTIYYSIEIKEHRSPSIRTYKKSKDKVTESTNKRVNNKETTNKYKVNCTALHLRTGPNAKIITAMPGNTIVTSDGKKDGNWLHVSYSGTWGYAYQSYLTKE